MTTRIPGSYVAPLDGRSPGAEPAREARQNLMLALHATRAEIEKIDREIQGLQWRRMTWRKALEGITSALGDPP